MAEVDHDIFGDSDSDQSFHGFTAEELNESIPREDISVEEYSSESENEGIVRRKTARKRMMKLNSCKLGVMSRDNQRG